MSRENLNLKFDAEVAKNIGSFAHDVPVGIGTHDNCNGGVRVGHEFDAKGQT